MELIKKLLLMPPLLVLGCLIAGAYGTLHDQVSYAVSPDYFHAFKFIQFQISPHLHDRLGGGHCRMAGDVVDGADHRRAAAARRPDHSRLAFVLALRADGVWRRRVDGARIWLWGASSRVAIDHARELAANVSALS